MRRGLRSGGSARSVLPTTQIDEMVGRGSQPDRLRVTEAKPSYAPWVAALVGGIAVLFIAWLVIEFAT